jgi:cell fate regulator YaaT (PSP1 superfamily)
MRASIYLFVCKSKTGPILFTTVSKKLNVKQNKEWQRHDYGFASVGAMVVSTSEGENTICERRAPSLPTQVYQLQKHLNKNTPYLGGIFIEIGVD